MAPWLAADSAARCEGVCSGRHGLSRHSGACVQGVWIHSLIIKTHSFSNHYISKAVKV